MIWRRRLSTAITPQSSVMRKGIHLLDSLLVSTANQAQESWERSPRTFVLFLIPLRIGAKMPMAYSPLRTDTSCTKKDKKQIL